MTDGRLTVEVDGRPLPPEEAKVIWTRFSIWMDDHRGDLAGFAQREGWQRVRPEARGAGAVLVVSTGKGTQRSASATPPRSRGRQR